MSGTFDGLSGLSAIQANIDALKNAQGNSTAALNNAQSGSGQVDINSYLIQNEKNFSQLLDILVGTPDDEKEKDSTDIFSLLSTDQTSTQNNLTGQSSTADLQRLAALTESSPLIGRTATYFDPATG